MKTSRRQPCKDAQWEHCVTQDARYRKTQRMRQLMCKGGRTLFSTGDNKPPHPQVQTGADQCHSPTLSFKHKVVSHHPSPRLSSQEERPPRSLLAPEQERSVDWVCEWTVHTNRLFTLRHRMRGSLAVATPDSASSDEHRTESQRKVGEITKPSPPPPPPRTSTKQYVKRAQ